MPTYEYKCKNCGHAFEKFHSITAAPIKKCPQCGKNTVERLISSGGGLIFKGSGFYITDYRDQSYADKANAESGSTEKTDAPATKSAEAESKPAAATETKPEPKAETKSESAPTPKPAKSEPKPQAKSSSKKK